MSTRSLNPKRDLLGRDTDDPMLGSPHSTIRARPMEDAADQGHEAPNISERKAYDDHDRCATITAVEDDSTWRTGRLAAVSPECAATRGTARDGEAGPTKEEGDQPGIGTGPGDAGAAAHLRRTRPGGPYRPEGNRRLDPGGRSGVGPEVLSLHPAARFSVPRRISRRPVVPADLGGCRTLAEEPGFSHRRRGHRYPPLIPEPPAPGREPPPSLSRHLVIERGQLRST
jgi:hypothetical protein